MSDNIIIIFLLYFIIIFATIGLGKFFLLIFYKDENYLNFGYVGLFSCLVLILYSYLSNFFFPHGFIHNSILILLGLILFIYFYLKSKINFINLKFIFLLFYFFILFISFLIFKTHEDFPYYHFPYTYYLTQNSLIIGLGNYDLGFRTPSSIFYLGSLFYLPLVKFYMFLMPAILFIGFANLIFIDKIYEDFRIKKINFLTYFSLLSFIFVNIFFYRIAAHGTDRSAQILVLVLILEILDFINYSSNFKKDIIKKIFKICILIALIISLKAFYILYLIFLIILLYYLFKKNTYKIFFQYLFLNKSMILLLLVILVVLIKNFLITGCFLYPVKFTCFENFSWSLTFKEVDRLYNHYQLWSKGGMAPNYITDDPVSYLKGFNWVKGWVNIYFFTKVTDFLSGVILILIITNVIFYSNLKNKYKENREILLVVFVLFLLFFEWFYNHPDLRYGGYCIIVGLIFTFFSIKLSSYQTDIDKLYKKFIFLIILSLVILVIRNYFRILEEVKKYNYQPLQHSGFMFEENHYFRASKYFNALIKNYKSCMLGDLNCEKNLRKKINYRYYKYILLK
jgi:hypothetical protein